MASAQVQTLAFVALLGLAPAALAAPDTRDCTVRSGEAGRNLCGYDPVYAFQRLYRDFCGQSPSYGTLAAFKTKDRTTQMQLIDQTARACMGTNYWRGKDGILWEMAAVKIRPIPAAKSGQDGADIPLADYYDDYNLFIYHQLDGADARGVFTADYFVQRSDGQTTAYSKIDDVPLNAEKPGVMAVTASFYPGIQQFVTKEHRAGVLSTAWTANGLTMFSSMPRTTAAHFLRVYLGLDIAKGQGLGLPPGTPALVDYDNKGITRPECAGCHTTLDRATYPFTTYNGLTFDILGINIASAGDFVGSAIAGTLAIPQPIAAVISAGSVLGSSPLLIAEYNPQRIKYLADLNKDTEPNLAGVPEAGYVLSKPVSNLQEWGRTAANSDAFAINLVNDYWTLLLGSTPPSAAQGVFNDLAVKLKTTYGYSVEAMLLDLIKRDVYGAP